MIELDVHKMLNSADGTMKLHMQLNIKKGQFVTIYGDSGAGKTSTFRMLSGLMKPDSGSIQVHGNTWFDSEKQINIAPQSRKIAYVFQDYALFPNMTVRQNLEFALGKSAQKSIIPEVIELIELGDLQHTKPELLSGGQKQRVALARALVQQPDILLLDEPLSALDLKTRLRLQEYLLKVQREFNLTTLLISHDIAEILKLSDQVFIIEKGKVVRSGTPSEIFIEKQISGKFRFTGEILQIERQEVLYLITALVGNNIVKVIAQESEVKDLNVGDKVMLVSKAFNPIIYKID